MPYKDPEKQKEAKRKSYLKHKEKIRKHNKTKTKNFLKWWYAYKSQFACERCGETDIVCLDFHHLDPSQKSYAIETLKHARWKTELLSELKKCICLCSNCHRKEHHKQKLKNCEGYAFLAEEFRNVRVE